MHFCHIVQYQIGLKFATESGLLLKVGQYADKDGVMKFECELFSCFPDERETLFFNGNTVLKIKGIMQCIGKWIHYDKYMEPINAFSRMMNGLSVTEQPISKRKKYQKVMKRIIKDILRALIWKLHEAETPKYVRDLVLFHHSCASRVRLLYDELMTKYQWLHCVLKRTRTRVLRSRYTNSTDSDSDYEWDLNQHVGYGQYGGYHEYIAYGTDETNTLDVANIAVLFCHSDDITFMMEEDGTLSGEECLALIDDMVTISGMALDVNIRFLWPSPMPKSMRSRLENASFGLCDTECRCHFDDESRSVTFSITSDSKFNVDAQTAFQSRIESMIGQLSYVPPPKAMKKKKETIQSPEEEEEAKYVDSDDPDTAAYKLRLLLAISSIIRASNVEYVISADIRKLCLKYLFSGRFFKFQETYDRNGILYWLGTQRGAAKQWQNPAKRLGEITVTASQRVRCKLSFFMML